jgi:rhodanese-related sulfurtransferase
MNLTVNKITPKELFEKMKGEDKVVLLDVRAEEKYKEFHIKGTNYHIPKTYIFDLDEKQISELPNDKEIVIACSTGNSATKCAAVLNEKNYPVVVLEGGITAWKEYLKTL